MPDQDGARAERYPQGRGYGHDYMRGGEVFNGYGYRAREEFEKSRGEQRDRAPTEGSPPEGPPV